MVVRLTFWKEEARGGGHLAGSSHLEVVGEGRCNEVSPSVGADIFAVWEGVLGRSGRPLGSFAAKSWERISSSRCRPGFVSWAHPTNPGSSGPMGTPGGGQGTVLGAKGLAGQGLKEAGKEE